MGRPYDPFSGIVTMLFVFALGWALFGWLVASIWFAVTGRLTARSEAQPIAHFEAGERVLTPGYGLSDGEPLDELDTARERQLASIYREVEQVLMDLPYWIDDSRTA